MSQLWKGGLAVDIDDTLADTAGTCIRLMFQEFGAPPGETWETLLARYHQPDRVEAWKDTPASDWLQERLADPDFLLALESITEASQQISRIAEQVPISVYISSRLDTHQKTTEDWLKKHNFPPAPLVTRPDKVRERHWKLEYLAQHFPNIWGLVDDDIDANLLTQTSYRGKLFLIGRTAELRESIFQPQVVNVKSWEQFYNWIVEEKRS